MKYCESGSSPAPFGAARDQAFQHFRWGALRLPESGEVGFSIGRARRGAERFGLPSAVLGIPGVRWLSHWA